jgi:hypothetical protein
MPTNCSYFHAATLLFTHPGATSSLTYNVVGHIKTLIILAGGCIYFGDAMVSLVVVEVWLVMRTE